jgi:hypothetical protein
MNIRINNQYVDISFEKTELIKEVIKITKERCKCSFDSDISLYNELVELIEKRKKDPIDYSCIE